MPSLSPKQREFMYAIESRPALFHKRLVKIRERWPAQARRDEATIVRMIQRGLIVAAVQSDRVVYRLTDAGRVALQEHRVLAQKFGPGR